ncbi:MAG: hypothetical protein GY768_04760 [Planctomycetaceae bacterium]|nr:hypothetical protein [Planctomycetaceae bacterium]
MQQKLVLGVDGGGSKTIACLAGISQTGPIALGRGSSGSSNLVAEGKELALENLDAAIREAFRNSTIDWQSVSAVCFALAGSDRRDVQQAVENWAISSQLANRVFVVNDAEPLLQEFVGEVSQIALICGTGSLAYGRSVDDRIARAGGWGPLIGDRGSGYWLGIELLRNLTLVFDKQCQPSMLSDRALEFLQLSDPRELPQIAASRGRSFIASLSKLVEAAAVDGDPLAKQLCQTAAKELQRLVQLVAAELQLMTADFDLILSGGVLQHPSAVARMLDEALAEGNLCPREIHRSSDPVFGAVRLAFLKMNE